MCVSETWLSPNVKDEFIYISDFTVFRCNKDRGGGVCIYIRDDEKKWVDRGKEKDGKKKMVMIVKIK